jgi:hypothetical protein
MSSSTKAPSGDYARKFTSSLAHFSGMRSVNVLKREKEVYTENLTLPKNPLLLRLSMVRFYYDKTYDHSV